MVGVTAHRFRPDTGQWRYLIIRKLDVYMSVPACHPLFSITVH